MHMNSRALMATNSAPAVDRVMEETCRSLFANQITNTRLRDNGKIKFLEFSRKLNHKTHIRAFRLTIGRAHFNDKEKEAGHNMIFVGNLTGSTLELMVWCLKGKFCRQFSSG